MSTLNDEQVENWRRMLFGLYGPFAMFMSREQIQATRDRFQKIFDDREMMQAPQPIQHCQCDPGIYGATTHKNGRVTCNECGLERQEKQP